MALVDLSVPSRSLQEWMVWSYSNFDHHMLVSNALFSQKGLNIARFPLDPIAPEQGAKGGAPGLAWLFNHQQWHNLINSALNTEGVDLTAVDFSRQDQAEAWSYLHLKEHLAWALKLGIA